jgi:hypothetical protein
VPFVLSALFIWLYSFAHFQAVQNPGQWLFIGKKNPEAVRAGSRISKEMNAELRTVNLIGLVAVLVANMLLVSNFLAPLSVITFSTQFDKYHRQDPLVTLEYAMMRTIGVINPLLVGEVVDEVSATFRMSRVSLNQQVRSCCLIWQVLDLERMLQQVALKTLVHYKMHEVKNFDELT